MCFSDIYNHQRDTELPPPYTDTHVHTPTHFYLLADGGHNFGSVSENRI